MFNAGFDAGKIFADLRREAESALKDFDVDAKVEDAKRAGTALRERLETDPNARAGAAGVGGLLLLGLLGTKGGRSLASGVAKTGAAAALGALAYKAWTERRGGGSPGDASVTGAGTGDAADDEPALRAAGYPTNLDDDPAFAEATLLTMIAAARADGVLDASEQNVIDAACADLDETDRRRLTEAPDDQLFATIARAAKSPNHAAELYTAAAVMARDPNADEAAFLERLRARLGVDVEYAAAIRRAAQQ